MRRSEWLDKKARLEQVFNRYEHLPVLPPDIRLHWVKYLVILTSGFVESSIAYIYGDYAQDKATPRLQRYIASRLDSPGNMSWDRLSRLVQSFGTDWIDELNQHPDRLQLKSALDSIISNRNNIAHGENIATTIGQLRSYYDSVVRLLDFLYEQCDRESQSHRFSRRQRR